MQARVTKRVVDAAAPTGRDQFVWDTDVKGFGLKVTPVGRKVYLLQTRVGGRLRRYTIGTHGSPWTPDAARSEALRLLGLIHQAHALRVRLQNLDRAAGSLQGRPDTPHPGTEQQTFNSDHPPRADQPLPAWACGRA
jgi:hypothetical protein